MVEYWGGHWTKRKLAIFDDYLKSYLIALKNQPFQKIYVDAFAGEGSKIVKRRSIFFGDENIKVSGSPYLALERSASADKPFDAFVFIELDNKKADKLRTLRDEFPQFSERIEVRQGDANEVLCDLCSVINWSNTRALVFLDPFGMQVKWSTIERIAETGAVDLWLLFPLGVAVTRLLKKQGSIENGVKLRLNQLFGTDQWQERFYRVRKKQSIFRDSTEYETVRTAGFQEITDFIVERLEGVFGTRVIRPFPLFNTKNNPLYLLCFACANSRGVNIANKIAEAIVLNHSYKQPLP